MSTAKATKKSAFSCEQCRRRKVKCGGEQPMCHRCTGRNEECVYKLNPTLSYTQRLEDRIKELEHLLAKATASKSPVAADTSNHSSPSPRGGNHSFSVPSSSKASVRNLVDDCSITRGFRGLTLDDHGGITYHGATSFFNLPSEHAEADAADEMQTNAASEIDTRRRERLISNAWQQRVLERLHETPEPFRHLLEVHWCWIQPLFNFIYRPAFTRDMQNLGPYYSHMLMNAVLSHSIRWAKTDPNTKRLLDEKYDGGRVFGRQARALLFEELSEGVCTIPTVQTLLLLSAQECSLGNATQAWTYSGLAFRLIDHLGICLDGERYRGSVSLTDEDVEIRRRLFWSCYFWDKIISLYLGRSPSLQHSTVSPPQMMFDDSAEDEVWNPVGAPPQGAPWLYPEVKARSTSCFLSMCRLSVIFNEILIHMYDPVMPNTEEEIDECLKSQEPALQQWWYDLSPNLKIDIDNLPLQAPPSHIVTTNCLYYVFNILLYRPMLTRRDLDKIPASQMRIYFLACVNSATSIISIFDLFCRTFSMNYCILSLAYSIYIAASIFLLQVQASPHDQEALRKLNFCIISLNQVKTFSPVINSALNLITKELSKLGISMDMSQPVQPMVSQVSSAEPVSTNGLYATTTAPGFTPFPQGQGGPTQPQFMQTYPPQDNTGLDPQIFVAMSSFEPLSVRVAALPDPDQKSPQGQNGEDVANI